MLFIDDDGGHQATSTIEYIADLGKAVHVVTTAYYIGGDLGPTQDITLSKQRLLKKGVTFTPDFYAAEIRGTAVHGFDVYSNGREGLFRLRYGRGRHGQPGERCPLFLPKRQGEGALPGGRLRGAQKGGHGDPRGLYRGQARMSGEHDVSSFSNLPKAGETISTRASSARARG